MKCLQCNREVQERFMIDTECVSCHSDNLKKAGKLICYVCGREARKENKSKLLWDEVYQCDNCYGESKKEIESRRFAHDSAVASGMLRGF